MIIIEHRVNTGSELRDVPSEHGVEIDIRHDPSSDRLYVNHDPLTGGKLASAAHLDGYLEVFAKQGNAFAVLNIKEAGIEKRCVDLMAKHGIGPENYFLLDVEFPFLYAVTRGTRADGFRTSAIAVRYSEAEPIEMAMAQRGFVDWAWIDTNTTLPLDQKSAVFLADNFKTCLVSPDRWRPEHAAEEIPAYRKQIEDLGFRLDAVMVGKEFAHLWE